jgi:hypothetical protein
MAITTREQRQSAAGVPFLPLGVNVVPGTLGTFFGRATAAWSYGGDPQLIPRTQILRTRRFRAEPPPPDPVVLDILTTRAPTT